MCGLHEMQLCYPRLAPIHSISTGTSQRRHHVLQDALAVLQTFAHASPHSSRQQKHNNPSKQGGILPAELTLEKSPSQLIVGGTEGEVAKLGLSVYHLKSLTVYVPD